MSIDTKKLRKQLSFCVELMDRLNNEINEDIDKDWYGVANYTQKKSDIMRLRRELNTLNKILYPWG